MGHNGRRSWGERSREVTEVGGRRGWGVAESRARKVARLRS